MLSVHLVKTRFSGLKTTAVSVSARAQTLILATMVTLWIESANHAAPTATSVRVLMDAHSAPIIRSIRQSFRMESIRLCCQMLPFLMLRVFAFRPAPQTQSIIQPLACATCVRQSAQNATFFLPIALSATMTLLCISSPIQPSRQPCWMVGVWKDVRSASSKIQQASVSNVTRVVQYAMHSIFARIALWTG